MAGRKRAGALLRSVYQDLKAIRSSLGKGRVGKKPKKGKKGKKGKKKGRKGRKWK